jgi:hypothetical protein
VEKSGIGRWIGERPARRKLPALFMKIAALAATLGKSG